MEKDNFFNINNIYSKEDKSSFKSSQEKESKKVSNDIENIQKIKRSTSILGSIEAENALTYITDKIEHIEKTIKAGRVLEKYYETEAELYSYIYNKENNFNQHQIKFFKAILLENLYKKFISTNNESRRSIEKSINDYFQSYIQSIDDHTDLKAYFNTSINYSNLNVEMNNNEQLAYLLKAMENSFFLNVNIIFVIN